MVVEAAVVRDKNDGDVARETEHSSLTSQSLSFPLFACSLYISSYCLSNYCHASSFLFSLEASFTETKFHNLTLLATAASEPNK